MEVLSAGKEFRRMANTVFSAMKVAASVITCTQVAASREILSGRQDPHESAVTPVGNFNSTSALLLESNKQRIINLRTVLLLFSVAE